MGRGEDLLGFGEERAEQRAVQPQGSFLVSSQDPCDPISAVADGSVLAGITLASAIEMASAQVRATS